MELKEISELMGKSLRDNFRFYSEDDKVNVGFFQDGRLWMNYRTTAEKAFELDETTHFDLNVEWNICYLLDIELEPTLMGKGDGWKLYESVHQFARNFGSRVVRQTPSGFTPPDYKRTRRQYLLDRGYIPFSDVEVELVL
ncbi:MAG: hypothetical protein AABW91_00480 [Nanoarchaeota archaeon]